jgi:hypothetical protein
MSDACSGKKPERDNANRKTPIHFDSSVEDMAP